jgi:AraC family transcriptional regulator
MGQPIGTGCSIPDRRGPKENQPAVRDLYDGWISVDRKIFKGFDEYKTENLLVFSGGWIEVRRLSWSRPVETIWSTTERCYALNMMLSRTAPATASLRRGNQVYTVPVSRTHMVPPDQTFESSSNAGEMRSLRCVLDADLINSFLEDSPNWAWDEVTFHDLVQLSGGQIEWLLRRMYHELKEPGFASEQVIEALTKQLAIEIIRKFKLHCAEPGYYSGGLAPWRMRLIRERLHADTAPPDLRELAGLCDLTVRHLSRAFRTETGQTIGKYVESIMIERANGMLAAGRSVGEVAAALGYSTSGSFSSAFRRATGLLPSQIKAMRRPAISH